MDASQQSDQWMGIFQRLASNSWSLRKKPWIQPSIPICKDILLPFSDARIYLDYFNHYVLLLYKQPDQTRKVINLNLQCSVTVR